MDERSFSDLEKLLIRRMIEWDEKEKFVILNNLVDGLYSENVLPVGSYIELNSETDVTIKVEKAIAKGADQEYCKSLDYLAFQLIVTAVELYRYLLELRLIHLASKHPTTRLGNKVENDPYDTYNFIPSDLRRDIYNYSQKRVFVTESLKALANRDFKTTEQIRHEEELKKSRDNLIISWIATSIALLALIATVAIPMLTQNKVTIENEKLSGVVEVPELSVLQAIAEATKSELAGHMASLTELLINSQNNAAKLLDYKSTSEASIDELKNTVAEIEKKLADRQTAANSETESSDKNEK